MHDIISVLLLFIMIQELKVSGWKHQCKAELTRSWCAINCTNRSKDRSKMFNMSRGTELKVTFITARLHWQMRLFYLTEYGSCWTTTALFGCFGCFKAWVQIHKRHKIMQTNSVLINTIFKGPLACIRHTSGCQLLYIHYKSLHVYIKRLG